MSTSKATGAGGLHAAHRSLVTRAPDHLRKAMQEGLVVPFIGAGISMGAQIDDKKKLRMPSYLQLLNELIRHAESDLLLENRVRLQEALNLISKGELLLAADILDELIPANSRYRYLRGLLNPLEPRPSLVHELLNILGFPIILTSNYDRILETTLYPRPEVLTYEDRISIPFLLRERKPFIFKIHGDLTRPETIVLGWSKYQDLQQRAEYQALRDFIKLLLTERTLLFLGCSLQGTEYSEYFLQYAETHGVAPGPHYALVAQGTLDQKRKDQWGKKLGIQILEYEADETHSQVWEFLSGLKPRGTRRPRRGSYWEAFYTLEERPEYLKLQAKRESAASSCRYLTPKIMNALAPEAYIEGPCRKELERFRDQVGNFRRFSDQTIRGMLNRRQELEKALSQGTEVRVVFLLDTVDEEISALGDVAKERFRYVLAAQARHPGRLSLRAYPNQIHRDDFMKSSFALIFDRQVPPDVDVAVFYAPQAQSNKFSTHIAQINTPYVTERVRHFEQRWSASLSEAETLEAIRQRAR